MDALNNSATLDNGHFGEQSLASFGSAPAQVAFADLGANQRPRASHAESLSRSLVRLDLVLSIRLLTWHSRTPLTQNSADFADIRGLSTIQK